jgi:hypothetical protein
MLAQHTFSKRLIQVLSAIREYLSNPRAKAFIFDRIKKDFRFSDQCIARFYQNMVYTSDILVTLPALKDLVAFEREALNYLNEQRRDQEANLAILAELLDSRDAYL